MIEVRRLSGEEYVEVSRRMSSYAFRTTPPLPPRQDWEKEVKYLDKSVYLGLFADGQVAACAAYDNMTQHVRGQLWSAAGVWGVATWPTERRHGYARQVLRHLLNHMHEEKIALSNLYPFREGFYERLGYVNFPRAKKVRFSPLPLGPLLKKELPGRVELFSVADGLDTYLDYLEQHQLTIPGMALFERHSYGGWREADNVWVAVARSADNTVVGVMLYRLDISEIDEKGLMQVRRFYYKNSLGKFLLLEWFARHADQAAQVEVRLLPSDLPETWWPDLNPEVSSYEPPMSRILNLTGLDGLQTEPGQFQATIDDPQCPWNNGSFGFETVEGHLQITPLTTATTSDTRLTIQGLTALVYGPHDPADFEVRGWGNPSPALQTTLREMFPPRLPYLHEIF